MKDDKVKYLGELLGVNEDLHQDYYVVTRQLLEQGLSFPIKLHLDNFTKENIIYSWFGLYRNYLQLVSSNRLLKVMEDYPGQLLIWEDDTLILELSSDDKIVWQSSLQMKDLDVNILDRIVKMPQIMHYNGGEFKLLVKLSEFGFERKFNEATQFTPDFKMNQELRRLKEKIVFAHQDSLCHIHSNEYDAYGQLTRIVHRIKLWGYDFSKMNYWTDSFTTLLKEQINLSPLGFRHTWAIQQIGLLLLESYDNESLLKEVENRLVKEEQKLNESYAYLKSFLKA